MYRSGSLLRSIAVITSMLMAAVFATWWVAAPASASHPRCGYHTEAEYLAGTSTLCRGTDTIAPPLGTPTRLLTRDRLLENAPWLTSRGFDTSFLWFAPESRVSTADLANWSYCTGSNASDYNGGDDVCDDAGESLGFEAPRLAFGGDVEVTILGEPGAFVALVCGNFSRSGRAYHPQLSGTKFHDLDADGVRGGGEQALAGWQFRVTLVEAALDRQPVGASRIVTSGADGRWSLDLHDLGPGTYQVEELSQDGWVVTSPPASRHVRVGVGIGDRTVDAGSWGNVQQTDTAKTGFALVDPPSRIDADTPVDLTVRVALANHGPTDVVDVTDELVVTGADDCTIAPARQTVTRTLREGETAVADLSVRVLCTEPSHHRFTFEDALVAHGAVRELTPENNRAAFTHVIEVFDDSDLGLSGTVLDCPDATEVRASFTCTGRTTVTNQGPYGPTRADVGLALAGPADCVVTPAGPTGLHETPIAAGARETLVAEWSVTCERRSFHDFELSASTGVRHLHVEDHLLGDDRRVVSDTVEVFEPVDLEVRAVDLVCTEREADRSSSTCTATVDVANLGPATGVRTLTDVALTPGQGCLPIEPVTVSRTLAAGTTVRLTETFAVSCTTQVRHDARLDVLLRNAPSDPHAVDSDRDRLAWLPLDVKPRSLPSSVNVGGAGTLPFALIGTARVDPLRDVDAGSLRFGRTGVEDSVTGCRSEGEDVDGDGRADRICHASTSATGVDCTTTLLVATGRLTDGTRFVAQDDVKVTGCGRR